jgi:S1-C subfamily serine protease
MNRNPRRPIALFLIAALVGGLFSPEAARAAAPIAIGLSAEAGNPGAVSAAGVTAAMSFGSPSAAVVLAPSAAPSAFALHAAPSAIVPSAVAAVAPAPALAASPVAAFSAAPAARAAALPTAAPLAAANGPSRNDPSKSPAPAPVSAPRTLFSRAASLFTRRAAPEAAAPKIDDSAAAKTAADAQFDGATERADETPEVYVPKSFVGRSIVRLGEWAGRKTGQYKARRAVDHDSFGGPKPVKMTLAGRIGYGVKWGLNLLGISALIDWTVGPIASHIAWPLWLSPESMHSLGRIELLTKYGPEQIAAALTASPLSFLGVALPLSTAMEEFTYRFMGFGLVFAGLALVKPITAGIAKLLSQIPDASGFRSKLQSFLINAGALVSFYAFPLAAARSSYNFAVAHFALWGISPTLFAMNMAAGFVLARMAYKTRGLVAPFVAHLTFNLAMLGTGVVGLSLGWPLAASVYAVLGSLVGVGSLWWTWRSARKEKAFNAKALAAKLLIAALIAVPVLGSMPGLRDIAMPQTAVYQTHTVKAPKTLTDPVEKMDPANPVTASPDTLAAATPAPAVDTAKAETPADMIARVKPSVLKIIVKMDAGMAIGSGVIVTPQGLAVTNGHVVGDRKPGQTVIVELAGGQKIPAKVVAVNHDRDQAFLQLPKLINKATGETIAWPTSPFAKEAPREGDEVYAMGHPLNLPFTVTRGIVSGRGQRGNMYVQYLQTDASINHGNSGGPLYNAKGEIIGINTMIMGEAGSIGLGFSIIAPSVEKALAQYAAVGNINTASFGVIVDLSNPEQPDNGVVVEYVRPGSAAAKAGIQQGDIIVGVGGVALEADGGKPSAQAIAAMLAQSKPGDAIEVSVVRGDSDPKTLKVTLDAKRTTEETSAAHGFDGQDDGE